MIEGLRRVVGGPRSGPWLLGTVIALVVAGPVLAPGMLLNLDLMLTPEIPVPAGVWGLGPELPRRLPFFVPMAWLSTVVDGATVGKLVMVLTIATAFAGAHRLAAGAPPLARIAAGLVYAGGPFLVTRLAVGHLGIALAAAVLPWALPHLLRPADDLARTLLWSAALGACGINGGILAGVLVLVGLVADRGRRAGWILGALVVGQLPWLVPGAVVNLQGVAPAGADAFDTRVDGVLGLLRLTGGQGFWIPDFDVGGERLIVPLAALVLVVFAAVGHRRLPATWRARALPVAGIGLLVAATSGLPGVDGLYRDVAGRRSANPSEKDTASCPSSSCGWRRRRRSAVPASVAGASGTATTSWAACSCWRRPSPSPDRGSGASAAGSTRWTSPRNGPRHATLSGPTPARCWPCPGANTSDRR